MSTLKNIDTLPHDLADGRVLASEQTVRGVEITDHERSLIDAGHLMVIDRKGRDRSANVNPPADAGDEKESA